MGFRFVGVRVLVLTVFGLAITPPVHAQSMERETPLLAEALGKQLVAKKKPKIAALDFTDIQGRPNELGRFLAEQLSVDMVPAPGITVIDRANLNAIMAEHKLTAEGLVDPENAKKLGRFAGVDAILVGNLAPIDTSVILTVRAVSTETAEVVAAGRMKFDITNDVRRMLGLSVTSGASGNTSGRKESGATASEPSAAVAVGPLTAVVKNVSYGLVAERNERIPQIRVTFDLQHRNLNALVGVSANAQVVRARHQTSPIIDMISGTLQESSGRKWIIPSGGLKGIPIIYCFETDRTGLSDNDRPYQITQSSPSNIVDYVKRAVEYSGGPLEDKTQRFWSGSFASIESGGKIEITAVFVPTDAIRSSFLGQYEYSTPNRSGQAFVWPETAELSLELVIATHQKGEAPEKAPDLSLRNLVISRLVLPKADQRRP